MGKYAADISKQLTHHFGEKGPSTVSVARIIIRIITLVMILIGIWLIYQDVRCNCSQHEHTHHHASHKHDVFRHHNPKPELVHWKVPPLPEHLQTATQDDPRLIEYIRKHWILPPDGGQLQLSNPDRVDRSQAGQALCVDHLLNEAVGGFFVEAGASNGETFSNSLYLERFRNWTGLLIEPSPEYFSELLGKKRNAYMINACLSPTSHPMLLDFSVAKLMSALNDYVEKEQKDALHKPKRFTQTIQVQCFPIYSILAALNITQVDYFSLDVAGPELLVLKTLPLNDINVEVLSVEYRVAKNKYASKDKMERIVKYMERFGYHFAGKMMRLDVIVKKGEQRKQDPVCFPQRTKSF